MVYIGHRRKVDYYYSLLSYDEIKSIQAGRRVEGAGSPLSIESMARPIGFDAPLDAGGNWLKNPIRPEAAEPHEWVELGYDYLKPEKTYVDDWLESD